MIARYIALAFLALLAACSPGSKNIKPQQPAGLSAFTPTAKFKVLWHRNIGTAGDIDYCSSGIVNPGEVRWRMSCAIDELGTSVLVPAVTDKAIYAANPIGDLFRLERATGKQIWRVSSGFRISGAVGAGEGLVLAGGEKGDVVAFSDDGKLLWQAKVSSEVLSAPQVAEGIVVVRSGDGRIAGLSVKDGKRLWLYERTIPALVVRSHAGVVIRHGVVYAGFPAGKLVALALASGSLKWEAAISQPRGNTELERISDITSLPEVDDEQVCAVAFQGRAGCFDIEQGNLLWSREFSSDQGMALLRSHLYLTDAQGIIFALDKNSGSSEWKNEQLLRRRPTSPYVSDSYLVVGDYQGYLHALKREDGSLAARIETDGSAILTPPIEMDGGLLVQTRAGSIYSIALH